MCIRDREHTERRVNFQNTLSRLLELGALPIINENDTVATEDVYKRQGLKRGERMPVLSDRVGTFTDSVIRRMTRINNQYDSINLSQEMCIRDS